MLCTHARTDRCKCVDAGIVRLKASDLNNLYPCASGLQAAQIRLARLAAYSSPLNGYSPVALGAESPLRQHWRAGGNVL